MNPRDVALRERLRSQGKTDAAIDALLERGAEILARREAEEDAADREAAKTLKVTPLEIEFLSKARQNGSTFTIWSGQTDASGLRARGRRLEKRGLVTESLTAITGDCHFTLTRLGRYVALFQEK